MTRRKNSKSGKSGKSGRRREETSSQPAGSGPSRGSGGGSSGGSGGRGQPHRVRLEPDAHSPNSKSNSRSSSKLNPNPRPNSRPNHSPNSRPISKPNLGSKFDAKQAIETTRKQMENWRAQAMQPVTKSATALDPWQEQACNILHEGGSVVVDAPTSAGKTRVVESFFAAHIHKPGFRAAYTTPVKSLSNDKVRELRAIFGAENVGIATGDIKENLNAPIVVATLESYRNSLLGTEPDLGRTLVVFDEYHYLQDPSRGSAWEEALILTPASCQLLMLSASVANAEEICTWLTNIRKLPCELVRTTHRPVPLAGLVHCQDEWILADQLPPKLFEKPDTGGRPDRAPQPEEIALLAKSILDRELTPCIMYAGRRIACERLAVAIVREMQPLPLEDSQKIGEALQKIHGEVRALSFMSQDLRRAIQTYGVAWHHSGLAAPVRMAIEQLLKNGLLRFCTATMGLSLGINFSVRSTLISDYDRPGDQGFTNYAPSEVLQMLGRAGRRGRDAIGYSLWPAPDYFGRMGATSREACESRLRKDPTTFLGLIGRGFSLRAIEQFYEKSFLAFKDRKADLSIVQTGDVQDHLSDQKLPCRSPTSEIVNFWKEDNATSLCPTCKHRRKCHTYIEDRVASSRLAHMHLHLHSIGALDDTEKLTSFGSVARYFPQAGGMLIARRIADNTLQAENLGRFAELMGAFSLARFKEPRMSDAYRFPFKIPDVDAELRELYPIELFEDLYDLSTGRRGSWKRKAEVDRNSETAPLRELNPAGAYIVHRWLSGIRWEELVKEIATDGFGAGDIMNVLVRVATYMQSLGQSGITGVSPYAIALRKEILRDPLSLNL